MDSAAGCGSCRLVLPEKIEIRRAAVTQHRRQRLRERLVGRVVQLVEVRIQKKWRPRLVAVDAAEIAFDVAGYHEIRLNLLKHFVVKKTGTEKDDFHKKIGQDARQDSG